jgi:hypothetical protein
MNKINGKHKYFCLQVGIKAWDSSNHLWTAPNHFGEVYLTNELKYVHNHHKTRINFHTHPLILDEEKFIKNLLR